MKRLFIIITLIICSVSMKAQDTIIMRDFTKIEVKVIEVSDKQVVYKKWNYQDGPTFRVDIDKIYNVIFANGDTYYDKSDLLSEVMPNYVYDFDGNAYAAVRIGGQIWMASNLRTKHMSDGSEISTGRASSERAKYYDFSSYSKSNTAIGNIKMEDIGMYYNYAAASDGRGLCPTGWHVPNYDEWTALVHYVGGMEESRLGGSVAKALASQYGWTGDKANGTVGNNPSLNNATFFSAFPAGYIKRGSITDFGDKAWFWTSTGVILQDQLADAFSIAHDDTDVELCRRFKDYGFSIRCVKN